MKMLSVRDLRTHSARVWKELPTEKEIVVTSNGRPVAVLTAVDAGSVEESLAAWRRVRAMRALSDLQEASVRQGADRITPGAIDAEIREARKARRRG
jgi:prevent-host-death family protein